jgi:mono/diheme cytochrome c family protein
MRRTQRLPIAAAIGMLSVLLSGGAAPAQETSDAKLTRGSHTYADLCASCHGRYGRGDGPLAANLNRPRPDFSDASWLGGRSDEEIVAGLTTTSHGPMAIATLIDPDTLADAIAYVRRLSIPGQKVSLLQGRDIYQSMCWVCHGREGRGDGPAAKDRPGPAPRNFTDPGFVIAGREEEIAQTIALGAEASFHGSPFMPEWASRLTPRQIDDVVWYLKTLQGR